MRPCGRVMSIMVTGEMNKAARGMKIFSAGQGDL